MAPTVEKRLANGFRATAGDVATADGAALMDKDAETAKDRQQLDASERKGKAALLIVTGCIFLEFFRLALYQEVLGPTLPYLRSRVGSDYAAVTQSMSGKAVGAVIGGVIAGFMAEKFKNGWCVVICTTQAVSAIWMAAMPFAPHVGVFWAAFISIGFLEGSVNIFAQEAVLRMWQAKAAAPLHLLHFGFGCGSITMPLIVSLFFPKTPSSENGSAKTVQRLNGSCVELVNGSLAPAFTFGPPLNMSTTTVGITFRGSLTSDSDLVATESLPRGGSTLDDSPVQYAFVLLASFGALCTAVFLALLAAERRGCLRLPQEEGVAVKAKPRLRDSLVLSSCLPHSRVKVALLLAGMVAFGAVIAGVDRTFGSFIFVYAKQELCFTDTAAVALNSAFWGAFTGGRMVGFAVAHYLHPKYFFLAEVSGLGASCVALAAFGGGEHATLTWVFSLGAGFFLGPTFPSFLAWSNRYITVTGMTITLVLLGISAGYTLCLTVVGHYLDQNVGAVSYFAAGFALALLAVAAALQAVGSSLGDRFAGERQARASANDDVGEEMAALKANGGAVHENGATANGALPAGTTTDS